MTWETLRLLSFGDIVWTRNAEPAVVIGYAQDDQAYAVRVNAERTEWIPRDDLRADDESWGE